jgi:hypothetical protein
MLLLLLSLAMADWHGQDQHAIIKPYDDSLFRCCELIMTDIATATMDKTVFLVSNLADESDEHMFWSHQTPADRLLALELLRQVMYGYDPLTTRLQRILTIAEHP